MADPFSGTACHSNDTEEYTEKIHRIVSEEATGSSLVCSSVHTHTHTRAYVCLSACVKRASSKDHHWTLKPPGETADEQDIHMISKHRDYSRVSQITY